MNSPCPLYIFSFLSPAAAAAADCLLAYFLSSVDLPPFPAKILAAVDVDFFNVHVLVTQLPLWSKCWCLSPKSPLRPEDEPSDLIPLTSEPCILLISAALKDSIINKLASEGTIIAPSLGASVSLRPVHIWVSKLISVLSSLGLTTVQLLGYGHKQPIPPFVEQLPVAPRISRIVWEFSPGSSVDIFADENTYDIGLTVKTPGVFHLLHADPISADLLPSMPQFLDPASPLFAASRLAVDVFPMFSQISDDFGSLKIRPIYDRTVWKPLSKVT